MNDSVIAICSILSLFLSVILIIKDILKSRLRLDVKINDYVYAKNIVQLYLYIYNPSNLPANISSVDINHRNKKMTCELLPKKVIEKSYKTFMTPEFPINISPHEGLNVFLEFLDCKDIELKKGNQISLTIHTNLKPLTINQYLPDVSHYLHKK